MLRSQHSIWPQQSSLPNDCHEFKQARITRGAQPWRSHCSERSWRYTSRAYNRWLSWLRRDKNAGVSLLFVCIRCTRIATFESLFNLSVNLKVVNCYKIGFLDTFKVSTTKMKLDGMHRIKFWKIDNFWNGTQNWINGTQKIIRPNWKYFTTFLPQNSHF